MVECQTDLIVLFGGEIAQMVECQTDFNIHFGRVSDRCKKPDAILMLVQFPSSTRDFYPRVNFQRRLFHGVYNNHNNNRELIEHFRNLKELHNLKKNIQFTNIHNYTNQ